MPTKSKNYGGVLTYFDTAKKYIYTRRESRYQFHDDFDTYTTIPAAGSRANGTPWVQHIVGAAPPTLTLAADHAGGAITSTLTSASQAQTAVVSYDDNRHISLDRACVFQAYLRFTTLPTLLGIGNIGLSSDYNAGGLAGTTYCAGFQVGAAGATTLLLDDNVTPQTSSTIATLAVDTWYCMRIESLAIGAVRFFLDGALVGTSYSMSAVTGTANAVLQPYIGMSKASGAGLGVFTVDSVDVWQE